MYNLVPLLSTVLPIIASFLLIIVISINLYLKIRRKFPVSVNCWFCNTWTKVSYDDRNSFDCPSCSQYNGFAKDGGYNKIIPEQHDELMNKSTRVKSKSIASNGLCALCNNNQQLKIFQLAHFVPMAEDNYDVEIEHFQEQLEKAYKLCKKCDRVLKKTIDKQNAWIFGNKLKNMCSNGFSKVATKIKTESELLSKIDAFLSTILVLAVIFTTISSIKLITKSLAVYVPADYLPFYKDAISALNTSKKVLVPYFTKAFNTDPYSVICATGVLYHIGKLTWGRCVTPTKINKFLCWVILFLVAFVRHSKSYHNYISFIEAFPCIYLLATAFSKDLDTKTTCHNRSRMRKLVKNLEYTCTDLSESSDFETTKHCSSTSSDSFNKSHSSLDVPITPFNTAGSVFNSSFNSTKTAEIDLNKSLNNLHLGGLSFKSPNRPNSAMTFALKRPKPVLSPPKFQTVNSWVAGGFWKPNEGVLMPVTLSRSSSESSGFGSQHNEFGAPQKGGYFSEFDKVSMNSEFTRLSPSPPSVFSAPEFHRKTFYPNLHNNGMLVYRGGTPGLIKFNDFPKFENWSDKVNFQATQSFRDLRLGSNN